MQLPTGLALCLFNPPGNNPAIFWRSWNPPMPERWMVGDPAILTVI
jgi:hypothetical protein